MRFRLPLLVMITPLLLTACSEAPESGRGERNQAPKVVVEPVKLSTERTRVDAVGTSRANRSVTLYPATSGEVVAVRFKPGQYVTEGLVLVELDRRDELLAVELAEYQLKQAQRLYERYQNSAATGATLPTTLDAAKTELEAARISLGRANINLEYRTIKAPFSGHVGITDVEPGERIQPATAITTLDDRSSLLVSFAVPELLIGRLRVGDPVNIATWAANSTRANGELIEIDSRINPDTRTFLSRARVANPGDQLRPGMSFRVQLDLKGDAYPTLPELAVQWGVDGSYIWTVVDGKAKRIPVNIVQRLHGRVLVRTTLLAGELVVTEGLQRLRPGIEVRSDTSLASEAELALEPGAG